MSIVGFLYRLARWGSDTKAITSGSPRRIGRRAKNKLVGRVAAKAGFWARLWR